MGECEREGSLAYCRIPEGLVSSRSWATGLLGLLAYWA